MDAVKYAQIKSNKTEFIIFISHAPLKKLDPYLSVRLFGNSMHPAVVKYLGVWFDANFSFADHVRNICKTYFIEMHDLRPVRQYLKDEAATVVANALVSSLFTVVIPVTLVLFSLPIVEDIV